MKKIAIVDSSLGPGGAEKLIVDMAPVIAEKGYDVEVIIFSKYKDVFSSFLYENNIKLTFIGENKNYWDPTVLLKLFQLLRGKDLIYTHVVHAQYFVAILSFFMSKRIYYVTTEHNTNNRRRGNRVWSRLDRLMYKRYNKVISITEKVENNLLSHLYAKKTQKFSIVNNGVNIEKYFNATPYDRKSLGFKKEDIVIVMVGRFVKAKDQPTLIKAINFLPENYKLLLIGDGELRKESEAIVDDLFLQDRVKFITFSKFVPELLKMSDVSILSSFWEGLPLAAIEGMSSGKPFLGSKVEGIEDLICSKELLFEQGDHKELASKVSRLFSDEEFYYNNIQVSRRIAKNYSLNYMVDRYLDVC